MPALAALHLLAPDRKGSAFRKVKRIKVSRTKHGEESGDGSAGVGEGTEEGTRRGETESEGEREGEREGEADESEADVHPLFADGGATA